MPEWDYYAFEDGEVVDIIIEEPEEEEQGWVSGHPTDQLEEVPIREGDPTKVVKVGGGLDHEVKRDFVIISSMYTSMDFPICSLNNLFTMRWYVAPTFLKPNGITL